MNGDRVFDAGVIDVLFEDASRYRLAWLSAVKRARLQKLRAALRDAQIKALKQESDQRQHQLVAELDRNKELHLRVIDLERKLADCQRGYDGR